MALEWRQVSHTEVLHQDPQAGLSSVAGGETRGPQFLFSLHLRLTLRYLWHKKNLIHIHCKGSPSWVPKFHHGQ